MSLNGVQQTIKGLLDQLALPLDLGTLNAYILPPDPGDGTQAAVYIWGSTQEERRQTMPRAQHGNLGSGGFKVITHKVDGWLIWFGSPDDARADSQFPLVIDAINAAVRNCPMPMLALKDPDTGAVYDILSIGEIIDTDYAPVHSTDDERWLAYNARFIWTIMEKIQA